MKINTPLVALFLTAGVAAGTLLMQRQAYQDDARAVAQSTRAVSSILSEAQRVLTLNRAFLGLPCTPQLVRQMGRSAALSPHLRGVRLLQDGLTVCASLSGAPDVSGPVPPPGAVWLQLQRGDVLTPDIPVLVLTQAFPEGQVAVSLSGVFIRAALKAGADRPALLFRTVDREMDAQGRVRARPPGSALPGHGTFPFMLVPDPRSPVSGAELLRAALPWLLLSMAMAMLATQLCQRLLRRRYGPEMRFQRALTRGEIQPWYQPVMDSRTGALAGCEVLARWHPRRGGAVPPDVFIPQLEKNGQMATLTCALLGQVARDLTGVRDGMPADFHLAFNISVACAADAGVLQQCRALQAALPGVSLVAELTERECFDPACRLPEGLSALRAAGVKVALDDFGTGYAGLSGLDTLPVDIIKLDRSFTAQITETRLSGERVLMAEVVTDIAHRLGPGVVAEGVETAVQRDWLTAHGVNWQQGYLFSRPLPAGEFIRFVREARREEGGLAPAEGRVSGAVEEGQDDRRGG